MTGAAADARSWLACAPTNDRSRLTSAGPRRLHRPRSPPKPSGTPATGNRQNADEPAGARDDPQISPLCAVAGLLGLPHGHAKRSVAVRLPKGTIAAPAARPPPAKLNMRPPGLHIYASQSCTENARTCRGQSADTDRSGPGGHICNVFAKTICAKFHKPSPRKRAHAADRDGPWVRREISPQARVILLIASRLIASRVQAPRG